MASGFRLAAIYGNLWLYFMLWQKTFFFFLLAICFTPFISPPIALTLGILLALLAGNPFPKESSKITKYLLQFSVVLLGFGMNISSVIEAGKNGISFTVATIFGTLLAGFLIGKLLAINSKISALISSGTAICGGSAIAAVAPVVEAEPEEISVSLATIFILNSIALFIFPPIGAMLSLSQDQFGIWAAIAIHDTSSVVGAAAIFGEDALQAATTIKLARALWIAPLALLLAFIWRNKSAKVAIPWFILLFLLATLFRTYAPPHIFIPSMYDSATLLAKKGLTITLFLIGSGLSAATLKSVGPKPLLQGILLWVLISVASLAAILFFI